MADRHKSATNNTPIREDSSVRISQKGANGKQEIEAVKPIYRPPERMSEPIKPHWALIWLIIIALVLLAWMFLFSYFSHHHAPYSAPL